MDDAVEMLATMKHTCSLDIAEANPDGLSVREIGKVFGVTKQAMAVEYRDAITMVRQSVKS